MVNYSFKVGDLVWLPKKKTCGVLLSWRNDENDLLEYQIQYGFNKIKWFKEYEVEHKGCDK
jgi:hypothetical protein